MTGHMEAHGAEVIATAIGHVGFAWGKDGLVRAALPEKEPGSVWRRLHASVSLSGPTKSEPVFLPRLREALLDYAEGRRVEFADLPVDLNRLDAFDRAILEATRSLGFGITATYGEVALLAGHPGKAREAGAALGRNPVPLIVPCHRVVAAGGRIGGFSAPGGARTKARLLGHEGAVLRPEPAAQAAFSF